jgi:transcriptional regulator with XRE-family HTH domain
VKRTSRYKTLREYVDAQTSGKTQGDVAEELGVSQSALSSYLSGVRVPSREIALRIRDYTGIPLDSLLDPGASAGER